MSTSRRILIKHINKEVIAARIKEHYVIGRTALFDREYREVFLDEMHYAFIVNDAYYEGWVELDVGFIKSAREHDDFWMRISHEYNTTVLFAYAQTTICDGRFLVIENGHILRSVYQKYDPVLDKILMENNEGKQLNYEKHFQYPEIGQDISGFTFLDFYDDMQEMFNDYGYGGEIRKNPDNRYLHLEYLSRTDQC